MSRVDSGQDVFRRMLVATYEKQRETRDKNHYAVSNREQWSYSYVDCSISRTQTTHTRAITPRLPAHQTECYQVESEPSRQTFPQQFPYIKQVKKQSLASCTSLFFQWQSSHSKELRMTSRNIGIFVVSILVVPSPPQDMHMDPFISSAPSNSPSPSPPSRS